MGLKGIGEKCGEKRTPKGVDFFNCSGALFREPFRAVSLSSFLSRECRSDELAARRITFSVIQRTIFLMSSFLERTAGNIVAISRTGQ
jgi:hypothetical protein